MYDVIISGYVSIDRVIKIENKAKVGYTSIIQNKQNSNPTFGGCSTNIAYLLATLNKKALPVIRLGEEDLNELNFYDFLKNANVCMDATEIMPNERTSNCFLILDKDKDHITLFYPGSMDGKYSKSINKNFFEKSKYGIITVGAYEDNIEFFNKCKSTNTPLVFGMKCDYDAFPVDFLKKLLLYSEIIFTNEHERKGIEKLYHLSSINDLFEIGNAKIIVTTLGKNGSMYSAKQDNNITSGNIIAAEVNPPVDTTGGGDAYIAGFMYGRLNGMQPKVCCEYGSVLSSFIIEKVGCLTNTPTEKELKERYNTLILNNKVD